MPCLVHWVTCGGHFVPEKAGVRPWAPICLFGAGLGPCFPGVSASQLTLTVRETLDQHYRFLSAGNCRPQATMKIRDGVSHSVQPCLIIPSSLWPSLSITRGTYGQQDYQHNTPCIVANPSAEYQVHACRAAKSGEIGRMQQGESGLGKSGLPRMPAHSGQTVIITITLINVRRAAPLDRLPASGDRPPTRERTRI